jgi:hypothetical protein
MMAIIAMYGTQAVIVAIFTCLPVQAFWDKSLEVWSTLSPCSGFWDFANIRLNNTELQVSPRIHVSFLIDSEVRFDPLTLSIYRIFYANAALNIASDFAIVVLPMPAIIKLQMLIRQKITLMCIIALGGL